MFEEANRLSALFKAYKDDTINEYEKKELEEWLSQSPANRSFFNRMINGTQLKQEVELYNTFEPNSAFKRFAEKQAAATYTGAATFYKKTWFQVASAAAILGGCLYLVWPAVSSNSETAKALSGNNMVVIATHKGEMHEELLPDGSRVWLNAASSLSYGSNFNKTNREVELMGEAYFDIKADSKRPFKVHARDADIDVLGTSFNVMAYENEPGIITTLVEGRINVSFQGRGTTELIKGMQAAVMSSGEVKVNPKEAVRAGDVVAWKDNYFSFEHDSIKNVLRQISRWYNIEFIYRGNESGGTITGSVSRKNSLPQMLNLLRQNGLAVRQEGGSIFIE